MVVIIDAKELAQVFLRRITLQDSQLMKFLKKLDVLKDINFFNLGLSFDSLNRYHTLKDLILCLLMVCEILINSVEDSLRLKVQGLVVEVLLGLRYVFFAT